MDLVCPSRHATEVVSRTELPATESCPTSPKAGALLPSGISSHTLNNTQRRL